MSFGYFTLGYLLVCGIYTWYLGRPNPNTYQGENTANQAMFILFSVTLLFMMYFIHLCVKFL